MLLGNGDVMYGIPEELMIEILLQVPAKDIVQNCVLVSKEMKDISDTSALWRRKCELEGKYIPDFVTEEDYKKMYFFNPYTRNLIKNPCAQDITVNNALLFTHYEPVKIGGRIGLQQPMLAVKEGLQHWQVMRNGGNNFKVDTDHHGSQDVTQTDMVQDWPERNINHWATSFAHCEKMQKINLREEGVDAEVLDTNKPPIYISEWYAARNDSACHYELEVKLLSGDEQELDRFTFDVNFKQWTSGKWTKVQHVFKDYKAGVRFIEFRHLGIDRECWVGHYGPKFTLSSVKFMFD